MDRNKLIPIVGVVIALMVLWFLFAATRPDSDDLEDGAGGVDVEQTEGGGIVVEEDD